MAKKKAIERDFTQELMQDREQVESAVNAGDGLSGAQMTERCVALALSKFWETKTQ